ncbi:MAG: hypothetical protein RL651_1569 [Pseudomonadota bacterium]|jgi:hypothetical protein
MAEQRSRIDPKKTIDTWFDIKRYSGQRLLSRREWGQQIVKRAFYLAAAKQCAAMVQDDVMRDWFYEELSEHLEVLFNDPLAEWMPPDSASGPLCEMSVSDMKSLLAKIDRFNDYSKRLGRPELDNSTVPIDDLIGVDSNFLGHLRVNLLARDPEILASFKAWLVRRRAHFSYSLAKKAVRLSSDLDWINSGLLPFADIEIWRIYTGKELVHDRIAAMVSPNCKSDLREKYKGMLELFDKYLNYENGLSLIYGTGD